jgi:CheY-like chemotaxis protein
MQRILVIDDDNALRTGIVGFLKVAGYDVRSAANGQEAMRLLKEGPVDLVITDINMPEMDGIEVLMELRAQVPDLPVLAMSGGGLVPHQLLLGNASALGAVRAIAKPFDLSYLLEVVQELSAESMEADVEPTV